MITDYYRPDTLPEALDLLKQYSAMAAVTLAAGGAFGLLRMMVVLSTQ